MKFKRVALVAVGLVSVVCFLEMARGSFGPNFEFVGTMVSCYLVSCGLTSLVFDVFPSKASDEDE